MNEKYKKYGFYLLLCVICYFGVLPFSLQAQGAQFIVLLAVLPLLLLVGSAVWGYFYGFDIVCPIMAGILFLVPVFTFMNSSALIYALIYGIIALAGIGIGKVLKMYFKK